MTLALTDAWAQWRFRRKVKLACDPYERLKKSPVAIDDTAKLNAYCVNGRLDPLTADAAFSRISSRLRAVRILFLPSSLAFSPHSRNSQIRLEVMAKNIRQLRDEGFEADVADLNPDASTAHNGAHLANILTKHHRPTWVVSYSKAGLDTLHALILDPGLTRFVDGWIAVQTPFFGSPLADRYQSRSSKSKAERGGATHQHDMQELCTGTRIGFMDKHAAQISKVIADIPVMCVNSILRSVLSPSANWLNALDLPNDGFTPVNSGIVPGAHFVSISGAEHNVWTLRNVDRRLRPEQLDVLKILFSLLLNPAPLAVTRSA